MKNWAGFYFQKISQMGLRRALRQTWGYARGTLLSLHFKKPAFILAWGKVRIWQEHGTIEAADLVRFYPDVRLSCVGAPDKTARLQIGKSSSIGDRTEIHAGAEVRIGERVMISWDCVIMDREYHVSGAAPEKMKPVVIENDVLIGCHSIILKGVHIGEHAVVGAGSVVTKDVAPYSVVAGNPAHCLKGNDAFVPEPMIHKSTRIVK